jgi:glycosyltransferase involved in cell wall biosynthesis
MKKLSIVIPVYNEKNTILKVLDNLEKLTLPYKYEKEIIVVDDGSTDGSTQIISDLPEKYVKIIKEKNAGKGAALRSGFTKATGEYVVPQDADLENDVNDIGRMLEKIIDDKLDVLYGSRVLNIKNFKKSNYLFFAGGLVLSFVTNILYLQKITDEPTCYKMFKKSLLDTLPLKSDRFGFCPEVTALVAKRGIKIKEIPISYFPRSLEEGKKIRMKDFFEAMAILIKNRF